MVTVTLLADTHFADIAPLTIEIKAAGVLIKNDKVSGASFGVKVGGKTFDKRPTNLSSLLGKMSPADPETALFVEHVLGLIAADVPDLSAINSEYIGTATKGTFLLGDEITVADVALVGLLGVEQFQALHNVAHAAKND